MIRDDGPCVYVCDNSRKLKHKFERDLDLYSPLVLSISNKNEIMISTDDGEAVNFYAEEGNLKSKIKLPEGHEIRGIPFHYVLGKIILLTFVSEKKSVFLLCYSDRGKLESSTSCCDYRRNEWFPFITSHSAGAFPVVKEKRMTFI